MITRCNAIDLLRSLVSIPSPSGEEAAASTWLVEWLSTHGFEAEVDGAGNAAGRRGRGSHHILLLGHIDTFPGELPVRQEGDWLYGRGAVDAKGPLCAFAAAATLVEVAPGWQISVVGAVQEECATSLGARHLLASWPAPGCCVIGEPGGWQRITLGYKGRLLVDLRWTAPFAHSAGPARLPAEQAVDLWNAIVAHCETFNAGRPAAFDQLEPSLHHIATRDQGAYGVVELSLGFRLPLGVAPDQVADDVRGICRELCRPPRATLGDAPEAQVAFSGHEIAFRADKNTPLVRAFLKGIRQQGGQPKFVVKSGTSDMNVAGPGWSVPILAYGPGDSAMDHTPGERINLVEYWQAIEVLVTVLNALQETIT
jgi:LysW-gamma-L-lysine carboxypeptidase